MEKDNCKNANKTIVECFHCHPENQYYSDYYQGNFNLKNCPHMRKETTQDCEWKKSILPFLYLTDMIHKYALKKCPEVEYKDETINYKLPEAELININNPNDLMVIEVKGIHDRVDIKNREKYTLKALSSDVLNEFNKVLNEIFGNDFSLSTKRTYPSMYLYSEKEIRWCKKSKDKIKNQICEQVRKFIISHKNFFIKSGDELELVKPKSFIIVEGERENKFKVGFLDNNSNKPKLEISTKLKQTNFYIEEKNEKEIEKKINIYFDECKEKFCDYKDTHKCLLILENKSSLSYKTVIHLLSELYIPYEINEIWLGYDEPSKMNQYSEILEFKRSYKKINNDF